MPRRPVRPLRAAPRPLAAAQRYRRRAPAAPFATALLAVGLLGGCAAPQGLLFVQDRRVQIVSPTPLSTLTMPTTFRWRTSLPADQKYALILDLRMVDPGRPLTDLVPADGACKVTRDCFTDQALAAADVYVTTGTSVTVSTLPSLPRNQTSVEARLVLVDDAGRRQGESLWYVTLRVPKAT